MIIYLALKTIVLWAGLSAIAISAWRALDNFAAKQGWWE